MSTQQPYAEVVGATFEVIGDVSAYGILQNGGGVSAALDYIELIPGVGIGGREVASKKKLEPRTTFVVTRAQRQRYLFSDTMAYVIELSPPVSESPVPVIVALSRGNGGPGDTLNPTVYRRVR